MDVYSFTVGVYIPSEKPAGICSINSRLYVPFDLGVLLLGIYLKEMATDSENTVGLKMCT